MDAMAEALAQAEGEQDIEKKIEQALACPCLGERVLPCVAPLHQCTPWSRQRAAREQMCLLSEP